MRKPGLWIPLLGWTAITWSFAFGSAWGGALAVGLQPELSALVFLIVLTSTGQAVPSSPGYVGVYHAAAVLALEQFGVDPATALGMAVLTHALSYGSLVIVGVIALWTGGYTLGDVLAGVGARGSPVRDPALATTQR